MHFARKLFLPLLLSCLVSSVHATIGMSVADLTFKVSFNATSDFSIKTYSLPITGSLDGAGAHDERWGLLERGGDEANNVPTTELNHAYEPDNFWGPLWGTQTLKTDNSISLLMLTEAFAGYKPSSFAWAKSEATAGKLAEVKNLSDAPKKFSFTVSREFYADVIASADPGEFAFAEADWDFSFSQQLGSTSTSLFKYKDHIETQASLDAGKIDWVHISSVTENQTKEATFETWLDAGESTTFTLDRASLYSHALTAPDGGSLLGIFGATLGLLAFVSRRRGASRA